ncbi:MAG: aminotransferase class IV [Candidatus Eisenbacteria bacterium]|nr:aminotransferase class IV [Candidatus Eisenbacteria bacterium]
MTLPLVHLDGRVVPMAEARVPPTSAGFLCGAGTFTTARLVAGRLWQWPLHRLRLEAGCAALGFDPRATRVESLEAETRALAEAAGAPPDALARIQLFEGAGPLWPEPAAPGSASNAATHPGERPIGPGGRSTAAHGPADHPDRPVHRLILLRPAPAPRPPARVGFSDWRVFSNAPLRGLKLLSYAEPWRAMEAARANGFDEAIRANERGEVAGACRAGVLWSRDGEVFGPDSSCGGLESTTRAWAIGKLQARGRKVTLGAFPVSEVAGAEELILFSAGVGAWSAAEFQSRPLAGEGGRVATDLGKAFTPA